MHQLPLPLPADRPQTQFRFKFPRPVDRRLPKDPWLAALECDFAHPNDGRKGEPRRWLKRQICRGYAKLGCNATEAQLHAFLRYNPDETGEEKRIPRRTIRWGIRILKTQGFLSNVRRQGFNGPMLRRLHPSLLGRQTITYRTHSQGPRSVRHSFASGRESCRPTRRESCRVTSPQRKAAVPAVFLSPARTSPQDLGAGLRRRSSPPTFRANPTQTYARDRYRRGGLLISQAVDLLRAGKPLADLADELKWWAAGRGIEYSDTPAGCDSLIQKAITIAELRAGDPLGRFAPFRRSHA